MQFILFLYLVTCGHLLWFDNAKIDKFFSNYANTYLQIALSRGSCKLPEYQVDLQTSPIYLIINKLRLNGRGGVVNSRECAADVVSKIFGLQPRAAVFGIYFLLAHLPECVVCFVLQI